MQRYLVTFKRSHLPFKWFTAKTNRLALYSLSFLWFELNFYVNRDWRYSVLDSIEE